MKTREAPAGSEPATLDLEGPGISPTAGDFAQTSKAQTRHVPCLSTENGPAQVQRTDEQRPAPSALAWHTNANGNHSAVIGRTPVATVYPRGWWSSYLLGVSLPCASIEEGRAAVEAAWADWMARAGLVWMAAS